MLDSAIRRIWGKILLDSALDSAISKQEANSKIVDEFLGFCEASDDDKT